MEKRSSLWTFIGLMVLYAILTGINVFLPQGAATSNLPVAAMPAPLPVVALVAGIGVLLVYGLFGLIGLFLARSLGLPEIWDSRVTNRQRFLIPALLGAGVAIVLIIGDLLFAPINGIGRFPHPPFPTSIVAALAAGIGEETIFRLFFISFWTWLVSKIILRGRGFTAVYWVVSILSAVAFGMSHLPSIMFLYQWTAVAQVPPILLAELILLNGIMGLAAAYAFRKWGFLAPVGVHFWADVVWHVIWGAL
jgi:hypothetical protein